MRIRLVANARPFRPIAVLLVLGLGCSSPEAEVELPPMIDASTFVPASGTVRVNGRPLAHAVVTFLPTSGPPGVGETDAEGKYTLDTVNRPGIPPGTYKVAVSYLLSQEGVPQGLGPRSAMAQPPGMLTAKEALPTKYSALGVTELSATVPSAGGTFDFDLTAELPAPVAEGESAATPAAGAPAGDEPADSPPTEPSGDGRDR